MHSLYNEKTRVLRFVDDEVINKAKKFYQKETLKAERKFDFELERSYKNFKNVLSPLS